ncbi:MAG TPA: GNAT family N-acetyltransferase, partial [Clostridiales bacterium]|nr:GNAT family N-acetyltransferase [Clostridiales bacterium]
MNNISIRERTVDDAEMFYNFITKLDNEADYMLYEKGE